MEFNKEIKKVRECLNISQETLARELNVSFATINRLETGKCMPSYKTLETFNKFCNEKGIVLEGDKND